VLFRSRTETVACGVPLAAHLLHRADPNARISALVEEGEIIGPGGAWLRMDADVRGLLMVERTLLNFLMRLCGVAAGVHRAVRAIPADVRAQLYDTRKTIPGWRRLDKLAVRIGGGCNHRMGLFDGVLIKDNHIAAAGSITQAVKAARVANPGFEVEVEVDRLDQLGEAIAAAPDIILLDNFSDDELVQAVRRVRGRARTEASGGIRQERLAAVARTGVDRISAGFLTHSAVPADLSLEME
jgi:nicotinate-nucleotide pyrophosphorylase (carboxylating)